MRCLIYRNSDVWSLRKVVLEIYCGKILFWRSRHFGGLTMPLRMRLWKRIACKRAELFRDMSGES